MPESASRENAERTPEPRLPPDPESLEPPLEVDQVLKEELRALLRQGPKSSPTEPSSPPTKRWRQLLAIVLAVLALKSKKLARKPKNEEVSPEVAQALFKENLTALCLSGGGIRSASFCLGILQALAQRKLLSRFDYLSTVSGGGYIGSWLSAWRTRPNQSIATIEKRLAITGKPKSEDSVGPKPHEVKTEPDEVKNLRDFTSYLTPRRGLMSSDTWASLANLIRNLVLNWMLFLPLLLLLVWIPKFTVLVFELLRNWFAPDADATVTEVVLELLRNGLVPGHGGDPLKLGSPAFWLLTVPAIVLYIWSELFTSWEMIIAEQPHQKEQQSNSDKPPAPYGAGQGGYVVLGLFPAYVAACLGSVALVEARPSGDDCWVALPAVLLKAFPAGDGCWAFVSLFAGMVLWGLPFLFASVVASLCQAWRESHSPISSLLRPSSSAGGDGERAERHVASERRCEDLCERWKRGWRFIWLVIARALSGAAFGIVMYLAVALLRGLAQNDYDRYVVVFGISGFFLAHLAGSTLFAGLSTFAPDFDAVREWTARAGGWFLVSGLVWTVYASLVLWDPHNDWPATLLPEGWPRKLFDSDWTGKLIKAGGLISGIAAALFGHSPSTPAKEGQKSSSNNRNRLAVAGAVFFSTVVIFELSRAFDWAVLPDSVPLAALTYFHLTSYWMRLVVAALVLSLWAVVASLIINVNKFSLHTYYRNRLIRCYLGASNKKRWPNAFTGFDEGDNRKMAKLPQDKPFHIISITLNLAHGKNLAWQERKATSFTVSPLAVGNPHLGYRRAEKYGDEISLGTAMAISGAAASPNMGYHSSPPLALLMTLFNVRLGWWLGNPKRPRSWKISGPRLGFWPFIMELFGLTDDEGRFVYLSDGGHFENLGIYEMLRRRCRTIVAVDAVCDPKFEFEDLGNAIRKARIDFGVEVSFSHPLTPSPDRIAKRLGLITSPTPPNPSPYCAIGRIQYPETSAEGTLIYIKAAIHGDEPEDILSYAAAHNAFPHEPTLDQFFTESKFESYRQLGFYIGSAVFGRQHEDKSADVLELAKLANEHVAHPGAAAT